MTSSLRDAAVAQLREHLLADSARAQNQRGALVQFAKDLLGELYSRRGDGHGPGAEFRFRANALPYFQRGLEHAVEHRSGCALLVRER